MGSSQTRGREAEDLALAMLLQAGLKLVARNWRVRGGELDLVMRERDGTLVFVEVRARRSATQGSAAASVQGTKQRRILLAATLYLQRLPSCPPCRFDVVALDGDPQQAQPQWLKGAFALS